MTLRPTFAALVLAGCAAAAPSPDATGARARRPAPAAGLPTQAIVVQASLAPDIALARARERLDANGFSQLAPVRPGMPPLEHPRRLALATRRLFPEEGTETPLCLGVAEIIQVETGPTPLGSELHLTCYSDALAPAGADGECGHRLLPGCPVAGDRLVGEVAIDAGSYR